MTVPTDPIPEPAPRTPPAPPVPAAAAGRLPTVEDLVEEAVGLAHRWASATHAGESGAERRATARLAALVADPAGLDLAVRFVDKVARPEDLKVAADELGRIRADAAGGFLSAADRGLLGLGSAVAGLAPGVVVPLARQRLRHLVGHLVVDANDPALGAHLAKARAEGYRLNVNLLGEHVHGEMEALRRAERTRELLERPDVDYISIKVSALVSQISTWDTVGTTKRVLERLRPLYRVAAAKTPAAFVNLDMEEYRDLDLTLEVFEEICLEPEFLGLEAGIALQAYLPDSARALRRLIAFARRRRDLGGAPVKVRLVKGANLAMERVEAELHGWTQAPYPTKADVDANYVRALDEVLRPEHLGALRLGVASHNLFDVALAHLLAAHRGAPGMLDVEMLQGMAPAQARAVAADLREGGPLILYTPVVAPADFDVAVSYLVRRLEENAAPENFLHALFAGGHHDGPDQQAVMAEQEARFRASVADRGTVSDQPRRTRERRPAGAGFANTTDSDPAVASSRDWAMTALEAAPRELTSPELTSIAQVDDVVTRARRAGATWAGLPAAERAAVLRTAADAIEARRGDLLTQMAHEGGKTVAEADPEVSEAVDFARYYADSALELEALSGAEGLAFTPTGLVLVTPPWNFPVAIPAGGVLAALAAGSPAIIKPAPAVPGCTEVIVEAIHAALVDHGYDRDVLGVVRVAEDEVGRHLVAHPQVETVILTGAWETARMFTQWRADHDGGPGVFAETSGKNALIVTPSADYDLAVADVVRSAFGHAGQKCSAASLVILVGSVAGSERFRRHLIDAVASMRVGWPEELGTTMGPIIEPAQGKLLDALTRLEPGETWMVQPRQLDPSGRLWSPGVKEGVWPGSPFHLTEYFGPVLGVMTARTLDEAIELANAVPYGLTGGLHSLDEDEIARWESRIEVGNGYVNRHTTGAIVRRQSFGGWKRSTVGPGAKAGGPNYVAQLGSWIQEHRPEGSGTPGTRVRTMARTLSALTTDPGESEWLEVSMGSDAAARDDVFRAEADPSALRSESNVFRYRPIPYLTIRAQARTLPIEVARVALAAECAGVPVSVSLAPDVAAAANTAAGTGTDQARAIGYMGWRTESAQEFADRIAAGDVRGRVRVIGRPDDLWSATAAPEADVTLLTGEVLASGRREMLAVLREQAISSTRHRFGHLPPARREPEDPARPAPATPGP
ncbi:aldehyde dehydrogenase family protein [Occultella glacieicola]|uniref:L-glutamate gamma-semialdehyde dehydrogenase n=1 Tax=Occultella glacieicola TaxID=2518684 RepID=A0ABY2E7F2_9MICO|nr:bifunctional proline dehydrogenase/L-glutamate gamma-semialdehyde dehydrogenase [Occultella glacieicola]TDE97486.1 aldehyde dehydrogenase family protein [Occultella glacieicola]